jgi:hypothetical protein
MSVSDSVRDLWLKGGTGAAGSLCKESMQFEVRCCCLGHWQAVLARSICQYASTSNVYDADIMAAVHAGLDAGNQYARLCILQIGPMVLHQLPAFVFARLCHHCLHWCRHLCAAACACSAQNE